MINGISFSGRRSSQIREDCVPSTGLIQSRPSFLSGEEELCKKIILESLSAYTTLKETIALSRIASNHSVLFFALFNLNHCSTCLISSIPLNLMAYSP